MDDALPFASRGWFICFAVVLFARSMDFLSTWIATPNMVLEGNPIAKFMGWKGGIAFNFAVCVASAFWWSPALVISTTSVLVAARNFQHAWLMRAMGEEAYRDFIISWLHRTPLPLHLFCLFGQTLLTALVGIAIVYYAQFGPNALYLQSIGIGVIGYACAVLIFTLLALWRTRRALRKWSS